MFGYAPMMVTKTLSHYELLEPLGEGGMGTVYRAVDTRLGRPVAVKVLRGDASLNAEGRKRFVQEARAASGLNHPHIITIYDIGQDQGVDFIAMEYVAGQSLASLVGHPRARLEDMLKYAVQVADALAAAHAAAERAATSNVRLLANVSHELRTPLAALTGFIDTLRGPARDDPAARERFLGIMQAQAWRMARLIDDLLSLSRIELRAHQRPDTPVDLVPIVRQVADGLQTLARDRGVAIEITAPAEPLIVLGDRDELIRLFENLVENGLKYGASGKRVEIVLARVAAPDGTGEARVSVRDHGPGIATEHLPRLTERFYRVDVGESRAQGGTGLGLALVKHILNRHQGRLTIDSRPGEGATFTARLPLVEHAG